MMKTKIKLLVILALGIIACQPETAYTYQTNKGENGYELLISKGKETIITQSYLPAIQGRKPIENLTVANALGELYVKKLTEGAFPPSVSATEVESILP
ncbi:DUF4907 domain-containing protein [Jiulongibacter sp. NS-SX5]|uniref:DUF4907 domain-containing protein n=1 Tax=Jiulongibacter sp. NS-SX5 TaxID=3463854 RepID=UPI004059D1BB